MVWGSLIIMGILVIVWSRMSLFIPALVVLFLAGIVQAAANGAIGPLLLSVTPRELVGRIAAITQPTMTLAALVAIALSGYLDSTVLSGFRATFVGMRFHAVDTIFLVAGVLAALGGGYAMIALRGAKVGTPAAAEQTASAGAGEVAEPVEMGAGSMS